MKSLKNLLEAYRSALDILRTRDSASQTNSTISEANTAADHFSTTPIEAIEQESDAPKKKSSASNWVLGFVTILIIKNITSISNYTESNDEENSIDIKQYQEIREGIRIRSQENTTPNEPQAFDIDKLLPPRKKQP